MDHDVLMFAQVMSVIVFSTASFVAIGLGARILWRLGSRAKPREVSPMDFAAIQRLETAVDTIAIEVERISEAQRFTVALLSEQVPSRKPERPAEALAAPAPIRVITPH
jgi:hypothetical protein